MYILGFKIRVKRKNLMRAYISTQYQLQQPKMKECKKNIKKKKNLNFF